MILFEYAVREGMVGILDGWNCDLGGTPLSIFQVNKEKPKPSPQLVGGITVLVMLFVALLYYSLSQPHMDFAYFYYAFQMIWHRQPASLLYDLAAQHNWFIQRDFRIFPYNQYLFPPQFAVVFSWFATFPFRVAMTIWAGMTVVLYFVGIWLLKRIVLRNQSSFLSGLFFLSATLNFPFWWDLTVGNANTLVFFLVVLSLYLRYVRENDGLAGVSLGLAAVLKVSPEIFVLYLLFHREWRFLMGNVLTILAATLFTAAVTGISPLSYYVLHFSEFTTMSMKNGGIPYNSSLLGLLTTWQQRGFVNLTGSGAHILFTLYLGLLLLISLGALWQSRRLGHKDTRSALALGVLLILLLSPLIEGPHLMLAFVAGWLAFATWWDNFVRKDQTLSAETLANPKRHWADIAAAVGFIYVMMVLSPLDWLLRSRFPAEYFYSLQVLFLLLVMLLVRRRLKFESSLIYS